MINTGRAMKKIAIFVSLAVLLGATAAQGQIRLHKKFELGTAFSFQSMHQEGWDSTWWNFPFRLGYFLTNWLEVEPEVILSKTDYYDDYPNEWSYLANLDVLAHFSVSGRVLPFVLAGAGFGNGVPARGFVIGSSEQRATVLNFGAGLKVFVVSFGAIRVEYRFTRFSVTYPSYPEAETTKGGMHQIFLGVSVFF